MLQEKKQNLNANKKAIPKGWLMKKITDLLTYEQPSRYLVKKISDKKLGVPVLTANKSFVLGYSTDIEGVFSRVPVIIFDDFTTDKKLVTFPFKLKSSAIKILKTKKEDNLIFVFAAMQLMKYANEAHKRYYISEYQKLSILVPPLKEQTAIAQVLTDIDGLINEIEILITKKQQIKKGTMQLLLTGKQRLPGFTRKWEKRKLGEIADVKKGEIITSKAAKRGSIPVIAGGKISPYTHHSHNYEGDIITLSASGEAGYAWYHPCPIFASDCIVIQTKNKDAFLTKYIYFALKVMQETLYGLTNGTTIKHLYAKNLLNLTLKLPSRTEQTAIAQVLTDMDKEIEVLEERKVKYENLKKGMMEQLLTGKIRLI